MSVHNTAYIPLQKLFKFKRIMHINPPATANASNRRADNNVRSFARIYDNNSF